MKWPAFHLPKPHFLSFLVVFAIVIGGLFRFYRLNWDNWLYFHPDERNIAWAVTRIHFFDRMDPKFFAYGGFPIYLDRVFCQLVLAVTKETAWVENWGHINLIGRYISATISTATLPLVYLLAQSVFSPPVAVVAIWFAAFTPFLIQQAHFGTTESMITFFAVLLTYLSLPLLAKPTKKQSVLIGMVLGLSIGTKLSSISFLLIPIGALFFYLLPKFHSRRSVIAFIIHSGIIVFTALVVFTIVSPYTFLSWQKFRESMEYEGGIVAGTRPVVYVYQFIKTMPYLYQIKQLPFTQGPMLAILSVFGSIYVLITGLVKKDKKMLFLFLWPMVYFFLVGSWYAKFVRYMAPVYPFWAIGAAFFLLHASGKGIKNIRLRISIVGICCAVSLLHAYAFMHIYETGQTRIEASRWIYQNVPDQSHILTEHWDDGLPLYLSGQNERRDRYHMDTMEIYQPDDQKKLQIIPAQLAKADYITINSKRLYATILHLPDTYPYMSTYYQRLFDGSLGFTKVAQFSSYPQITIGKWTVELNDDASEETFQVFDHPKNLIFKNVGKLSETTIRSLLQSPPTPDVD